MLMGRIAAVWNCQWVFASTFLVTYACPRKSKPKLVIDFDNQVMLALWSLRKCLEGGMFYAAGGVRAFVRGVKVVAQAQKRPIFKRDESKFTTFNFHHSGTFYDFQCIMGLICIA